MDYQGDNVERFTVPGGWIYRDLHSKSICFVPFTKQPKPLSYIPVTMPYMGMGS